MADARQESPVQTVYRLAVVGGLLACGSMAAIHYGPEAGDLADMIDQTASMVVELDETPEAPAGMADGATSAIEPAALFAGVTGDTQPTQATDVAPRFDDQVLPASGLIAEPAPAATLPAGPSDLDRLERERLTAPLLAAGAERADVHPWGNDGNRMYRATASAPVGSPAARLLREFDAVAATPEAAVAAVRSQLRTTLR
ncbi:MAG: hypothetical protein AAF805_13860 [Planctomycetota bacterium]